MSKLIQARIDPHTERLLRALARRTGWSDSKVIREGIKALGVLLAPTKRRRIVGIGRFRSGVADLASNRRHLRGFGR
ncbi:MAG: hypothetical protein HYS13_13375 [Planctomycetia bacterium]|nr:hypothetical protein [Planctomycetia bacterium]